MTGTEISLRDMFAIAALQGYMHSYPGLNNLSQKSLLNECQGLYRIADAMLKVRTLKDES